MGGGKPTVPEDMRGTLTSSGSDSVHISTFTIFLCKPCAIAISGYSGPSHLENYVRVVAVEPDTQRASFHGVIDFLSHSTTAKLVSLYTHKRIISEPQNSATMIRSHCQLCICCGAQVHGWSPRESVLPTEAITDLG